MQSESPSGGLLTLIVVSHSLAAGNRGLYYNGTNFKVYTVACTTATSVVLAESTVQEPFLSAPVNSDVANNGTSWVGKLKWPNAWPIAGAVAVQSATRNAGNVDIALAGSGAPWLRVGDLVTFSGVSGLGNEAVNVRSDATHFSVTGTVGSYTAGGKVKSTGAPGAVWYNTTPTDRYVFFEWNYNYRDTAQCDAICQSQHNASCSDPPPTPPAENSCPAKPDLPPGVSRINVGTTENPVWLSDLRYGQCLNGVPRAATSMTITEHILRQFSGHASVILTSPEGQDTGFEHVVRHSFPTELPMDDRYGGRWQAYPVQAVTDPLWQDPSLPSMTEPISGSNGRFPCSFLGHQGRLPFKRHLQFRRGTAA